ncbi:hypothetical protein C8R46DRAFT_1053165 [Mycena filopes]|nr:hypothetical protein C8R46DRAFT_1053165 [Mycena filopes]
MASYNLTIEDGSPLISYSPSGAWEDASNADTAGLPYSGNSLHSTTARGATATVNFNGTGIEFYGGFQPSYGTYTLAVDGQTVTTGTATNTGVEVQRLLGSVSGLANGPHTAVLTSTGVGMDLDFVNLSTQVGAVGSTTTSTVFDDASSAITYAGNWDTANTDTYLNSTLHYSQDPGSAASLSFSGSGVAVYGTVAPDHANVQVSIDGKTTMVNVQSSSIVASHAQTLLYYANDLDASQHMLIITNPGQQDGTGPFIDLDSITVYSASVPGTAAGANAPGPSPFSNQGGGNSPGQSNSGHKSGSLSTGAMIGIIVAVLSAILIVVGLVAFLFLRRRRRTQQRAVMEPKTPIDAELPLQGPNMRYASPISPLLPMPTFSGLVSRMSAHSIAPSYYASNNQPSRSRTSVDSTTPMVPKSMVPTLSMPRLPSRAQQGVMMARQGPPDRPNRPPSLGLPLGG